MSESNVLLMRLAGPLQAWGVESRFTWRDTGREPSKSGVVGLLCAALGRTREAPIADLASLVMGVRADQEGAVLRDYHTAGNGGYLKADGSIERDNVIPGDRFYLMSARFLVGLQGDDVALLARLHAALHDPVWPLYLGRKACVPGEPVWLEGGLLPQTTLKAALRQFPWLGPQGVPLEKRPRQLRLVLEDLNGPQVRPDQPLSFAARQFAMRRITVSYCAMPPMYLEEVAPCTSHA